MIFGVLNPEKTWHQQLVHLPTSPVYCSHCTLGNLKRHFQQYYSYILQIIYVISQENKLLPLYSSHLKNVTALPCEMQNFFIWLNVMLRFTMLCWNPAYVATRRFRNSSVSWIDTWYKRSCSIKTQLYQPHLRWAWSNNQWTILPRRVADAEATTSNTQHYWRRVCLPARQCASTSWPWHSWASAL